MKLGENGVLVSNEIVSSRCKILTGNIERLGLQNTVVTCMDSARIAATFPNAFDLIMVDAPCSGEGMFRKDEVARHEWSEENVKMCAERQAEILENAAKMLKGGGHIIYATCTFSLEENEMNVEWFLDTHPEFCLCEVEDVVKEHTADGICFEGCTRDMKKTRRFYPYVSDGEGQFIALMRKVESTVSQKEVARRTKKQRDNKGKPQAAELEAISVAKKFIEENLNGVEHLKPFVYNGKAYLCPDIEIMPFGVFSAGVCMGEVRKGRLIPSHHLFSALGKNFKNKIELDVTDTRLIDYIGGFEIPLPEAKNGFGVITVCGAPLGGVKVSSGVGKNHYLK
jgi:NOL1/NOP2/fmu family ribosome biogenesis protein